jgi:hypothetical protein
LAKHLYLAKASDALVCLCRCDPDEALISSPAQMGCPWCGCGWLFICSRCLKAFTFARVVEVRESWEETAERVIRSLYRREPEPGEVEEWVGFMKKILLKGVRPGLEYVYLDGWVVPTTAEGVRLDGWHSRHDLPFVPQVAALTDPGVQKSVLSNKQYWRSTAREESEQVIG